MSRTLVGLSCPVVSSVASTSVIGRRRRCAATASPARVCAFSAINSCSRACRQSGSDTTRGTGVSAWPRTIFVVIAASLSPALDFCGGYAAGDGLGLPAFAGQYPDLVEAKLHLLHRG